MFIIIAFLTSALCGFAFIPAILKFCKTREIYDMPNVRKIHTTAIPRLGGISFIPSMLISSLIALSLLDVAQGSITVNAWTASFLASVTLIFCVGAVDDIRGVLPWGKFCVQIAAAAFLPLSGLYVNNLHGIFGMHEISCLVGIPLTILIIVFTTNAINLIDGIDGLGACLSLLAFAGFLYVFTTHGAFIYSILVAGMLGVLVAFLFFNLLGDARRRSKIFMGDSGSLSLGFILGFLCVKCSMDNPAFFRCDDVDFIMAYSLVLVPMLDAACVFVVRLAHRTSPFKADNNHIHHKLMRLGLTQHQSLAALLSLAVAYLVLNYLLANTTNNTVTILADIITYAILRALLSLRLRRSRSGK